MAKLRHIALGVRDPQRSAAFYINVFGLKQVGRWDAEMGSGVYLSDGVHFDISHNGWVGIEK
jgi:catechol 2,3-dioxygenase-like lactoylglutathione lyase family enzyme